MITLLLCETGVLREPLLYLSLYFKTQRSQYYALLQRVRQDGDREALLDFFLEGVRQVADGAVATAGRLAGLFETDHARLQETGRRAGSALRLHEAFKARPMQSLPGASQSTGSRSRRCHRPWTCWSIAESLEN